RSGSSLKKMDKRVARCRSPPVVKDVSMTPSPRGSGRVKRGAPSEPVDRCVGDGVPGDMRHSAASTASCRNRFGPKLLRCGEPTSWARLLDEDRDEGVAGGSSANVPM